jgi:hypothetical protein
MDFLKKHYEKVLLGVVLLGLAVGAALLPWMISGERKTLQDLADDVRKRPVKPLPELGASPEWQQATNLLQRAALPMSLDLSTDNRLFNPVQWQKMPDGRLIKITQGNEIGVNAVVVTKITPLYTIISLESVLKLEKSTRYLIGIKREAAANPRDRGLRTVGAGINEKKEKEGFIIREAKGPADAPELVLELTDTGDRVSLSKAKPFKRADGYMADLNYAPERGEKRTWVNQRVGSRIRIENADYNIVAISANEVVLSAPSGKKTSRPYKPGS